MSASALLESPREGHRRARIVLERRTNTLRVMAKPLADDMLEQCLARVERDRPEHPPAQ